ncbi:MAG: hypothetical protein ACTS8R_07250 [Arsenophonus sp. NC-QC1-MAG3]
MANLVLLIDYSYTLVISISAAITSVIAAKTSSRVALYLNVAQP